MPESDVRLAKVMSAARCRQTEESSVSSLISFTKSGLGGLKGLPLSLGDMTGHEVFRLTGSVDCYIHHGGMAAAVFGKYLLELAVVRRYFNVHRNMSRWQFR